MTHKNILKSLLVGTALLALVSCGNRGTGDGSGNTPPNVSNSPSAQQPGESTIWDLFKKDSGDVTIKVNKYIWNASLEVLNFLPVQSVDPFSGLIVTGYGTPPGGGRAYRATIYIKDPALDARTLNVAMQTRNGRSVSASTIRAVEDAILTRARQLRIADGKL
jgi:hypothetical protein